MDFSVALVLSVLMAAVIVYDGVRFIIPNWLNGAFLALFVVWGVMNPNTDWLSALTMFIVLFGVGYVLFALGTVGGGDVKLLAVCGLYTGWSVTGLKLVVYMSLLGGALALVLVALRLMVPALTARLGIQTIPRVLTVGEPAPYGVAIAVAFLGLLWTGQLPGLLVGQ